MKSFIALDLETATSSRSSICQIGITIVENGEIRETLSWLVRPEGNYYEPMNIAIHGITPKDTKNSPSFKEIWKEVQPYLQNKTIVAHNTSFDMYALRDAFDENDIEYPTFDYYCSLRIARYILKSCYSYSLDALTDILGIDFGTHHKADNDSLGCAMLLLKCLEIDHSEIEDLEGKYCFHRGKFAPGIFIPHLSQKSNPSGTKMVKLLEDHPELHDEDNYFFGKSVCFTGTCQFGNRTDMLQKIKDIGGIPMNSVTKDTDILVVGQQDYSRVGDEGMSSKQKKALCLLEKGHNIEILSEIEFFNRIR